LRSARPFFLNAHLADLLSAPRRSSDRFATGIAATTTRPIGARARKERIS